MSDQVPQARESATDLLEVAPVEEKAATPKAFIGKSPGQLAWARLRTDRTARTTIWILGFFAFIAIFADVLEWIYNLPIFGSGTITPTSLGSDLLDQRGIPLGYVGGITFSSDNPTKHAHILGVMPQTGQDIFLQLIYGARTSLVIAASATVLAVILGIVVGVMAGYFGGWIDQVLSWFVDYMLAFPFLLMAIAIIPIVNTRLEDEHQFVDPWKRIATIIAIFALFGWMGTARLVRGQVISLREREYVEAARAAGASSSHIMFRQILPNLWAPILVTFSLSLPATVVGEAALSFIGIGVVQPTPDWGRMINHSVDFMQSTPAYLIFPGVSIVVLVLAFNMYSDSLRDALDPKSSR
jgi:peptide/nickel transport system permease protein